LKMAALSPMNFRTHIPKIHERDALIAFGTAEPLDHNRPKQAKH
jgi:hypothetical protein